MVTDKEKLQALLDGRILESDGTYTKLTSEGMLSFCTKSGELKENALKRTCIDFEESTIVKHWYEDIPEEGVVCFTWNNTICEKRIQTIIAHDKSYSWEFISKSGENVQYAVPLTTEQLSLYNQLMASADAL